MRTWDVLYVETLKVEEGVPEEQLRQAIREGRVKPDDCVRIAGQQRWLRVSQVPQLRQPIAKEKEGVAPAKPAAQRQQQPKPARPVAAQPADSEPEPAEEPMPLFPRRRQEPEEIDMAPAATLALLLILFFIVASTIVLQKAVEFPKPSKQQDAANQSLMTLEELEADNIIVRIKDDNTILVDGEETSQMELQLKLTNLRRQRAVNGLIIRADERAYHQTVVAVMDAANLANVGNIRVATVRRRGSGRRLAAR
jgi:biopolymer transport protein ExbD